MINFGLHPISNRFLSKSLNESSPSYPMVVCQDEITGLISLLNPFPLDEIRSRYEWLTCFEPEDHLDTLVEKIISLPGISKNSIVSGYSFKDDSTLERLKKLGLTSQWRVDPKKDLGIQDSCAGIETFQKNFTKECAKKIAARNGKVDIFIVRHVLEHAYKLSDFIAAVSELINPCGYVIWEIPDCIRSLNVGDCTMLWEEHVHYFSGNSFQKVLKMHSHEILDFYSIDYPLENSLLAITILNNENVIKAKTEQSVDSNLLYEYYQKVNSRKKNIRRILEDIKNKTGKGICIFGAGHLTITFIALLEIEDMIEFVLDDNPHKQKMLLPIGNIEIKSSDYLMTSRVKVCLLGVNPHNHRTIILNNSSFLENNGVFGSIFPDTKGYIEDIYDNI